MQKKILIVEDDKDISDLLAFHIQKAGYGVIFAHDGEEAIRKAAEHPALILLDLMLPLMDGLEVCKSLKRSSDYAHIPIVMLTARTEETDRIIGLELGAEDYLTKPFSPRELLIRLRRILNRSDTVPSMEPKVLASGDLLVDLAEHRVTVQGKAINLTATEFKLLVLLMKRKQRVQTRDALLSEVWNYEKSISTRTVDSHIRRLRSKLGSRVADKIETIRGVGYRFIGSSSFNEDMPDPENIDEDVGTAQSSNH